MDLSIKIDCQISDPHHEAEIVHILKVMLPWMADNVQISSTNIVTSKYPRLT